MELVFASGAMLATIAADQALLVLRPQPRQAPQFVRLPRRDEQPAWRQVHAA
jgi:hypothetical protein